MKRIALAVMLLVSSAAPAWAGFDEGTAAYVRGDYATALREWKPLAEHGLAAAQYNLGIMYSKGLGVARDDGEAVKWYRNAAEQGYASAQHNLGVRYATGEGVGQDPQEARRWLSLAAAQGNREAQQFLHQYFYSGNEFKPGPLR